SMKMQPPWSRRLWTHPNSTTLPPMCDSRRSPHRCVRLSSSMNRATGVSPGVNRAVTYQIAGHQSQPFSGPVFGPVWLWGHTDLKGPAGWSQSGCQVAHLVLPCRGPLSDNHSTLNGPAAFGGIHDMATAEREISCPMCGFKNPESVERCRSCGAKVE